MNNKDAKKALKNQYKQKAANNFLKSLPMTVSLFKGLFDFLDKQINDETETDFDLTMQFCIDNEVNFEILKNWLIENGAGDDTEILWNIEEKFKE